MNLKSGLKQRHIENLHSSLTPIRSFLENDDITDIYINPDGKLWVKEFGSSRYFTGQSLNSEIIRRIINFVASLLNKNVYFKEPVLDGIIPDYNARIHALVEPMVLSPTICIRKPNSKILSLDNWYYDKRITLKQIETIRTAIINRKNIIVVGGTGSGKTTFLNSLINELSILCPKHRLYIVEDTNELICSSEDYLQVCVSPDKTVGAVRNFLRSFADRIIFGELRYGNTAYEFFKISNSGHPGSLTTIHANSAKSTFSRIGNLINECNVNIQKSFLTEVINLCIFLQPLNSYGPFVEEVVDFENNITYEGDKFTKEKYK